MMIRINNDWQFVPQWSEAFLKGEEKGETVRLPHTVKEIPLHYADSESYQMVAGYRKELVIGEECRGKRLFLQFDAAGHIAEVFVNGTKAAEHRCGYTAFRTEITDLVKPGQDNFVAVKLDTTENGAVPPFGFVIDYLTFGGLYRDVWLDERPECFIEDVYPATPELKKLRLDVTLNGKAEGLRLRFVLKDAEGKCVLEKEEDAASGVYEYEVPEAKCWDTEHPVLYDLEVSLSNGDQMGRKVGFRTVRFDKDSFYLNDQKLFIRGLNHHQCYPYIGYAAPESLQRMDARILKEELQVNAVRTSHYPQSHYFIDECDRLGILVFTEIPGWQHIGDEAWKAQALENTREMVKEYRHHPSIFLWGVRINESQDDDLMYTLTNAAAHELDPYRPTSGVRYIEKSSLLEDVYGFNDFSHNGTNPGVKPKEKVMKKADHALLITEASGHMFPTKSYDPWLKRQEHALRHARVLNDAMADGKHAGCFQWCMFDYPTHKDFGSGDRVCYHGVLDYFRNPKIAAAVYAAQGEGAPVLEITSPMDIGDYAAGQVGTFYALTNADRVDLYKNGQFVRSFSGSKDWSALPHGPVAIDDLVGTLLEQNEGFDEKQAELVRDCLNAMAKYTMANLPPKYLLKLAYAMRKYHMTFDDGYKLYGKYIGNWGGEATEWKFEAVKDGKVVKTVIKKPSARLHLEAGPSSVQLTEGECYDMSMIRVRILDEYNGTASFAQIPVHFAVEGPAVLTGPDTVTAEGGMCGTIVRTTGESGKIRVTVTTAQTEPVVIEMEVNKED